MKASDISGKKVLVIGTGLSGVGSVRLLHQVGAVPVMLEENTKVTREDIVKKLNDEQTEITFDKPIKKLATKVLLDRKAENTPTTDN